MGPILAMGLALVFVGAGVFYGDLLVIFDGLPCLKAEGERVCFLSHWGEEGVPCKGKQEVGDQKFCVHQGSLSILQPMIRVQDLTHRYGERVVLRDISLEIQVRESVAIMGGSGEGKTTLLRCMCGLQKPLEGVVELFGVDFYRAPERQREEIRRRVGVLFQSSALFDYLTVRDNVAFAVERRNRLRPKEIDEIVRAKLALVGLEGIEHLYPSELSGGMRKRVGLARALATDPDVLFLDEPTSGLDPVTAYAIDALIKEVTQQLNATVVLVTHDLNSVMRVAGRVLFLYRGEVVFDGAPEEFHNSQDPRIQEVVRKAEDESLSVF